MSTNIEALTIANNLLHDGTFDGGAILQFCHDAIAPEKLDIDGFSEHEKEVIAAYIIGNCCRK